MTHRAPATLRYGAGSLRQHVGRQTWASHDLRGCRRKTEAFAAASRGRSPRGRSAVQSCTRALARASSNQCRSEIANPQVDQGAASPVSQAVKIISHSALGSSHRARQSVLSRITGRTGRRWRPGPPRGRHLCRAAVAALNLECHTRCDDLPEVGWASTR